MRVLQVTERYPPAVGGVEGHVFGLARHLASMGVDVGVLTTDLLSYRPFVRARFPTPEEGVSRCGAYRLLPLPQGLGMVAPGMPALVRDADIVHAHGYGRFPTFLVHACRARGIPMVVTPHSAPGRRTLRKLLFDRVVPPLTIGLAQGVIALTKTEASYLRSLGLSQRISVIPNGIDLDEFGAPPEGRQEGAMLFVGRLDVEEKGLDVALRALAALARGGTDVKLRIMGPGPKDAGGRLRSMASALGVEGRLTVEGQPSRRELVEAMRSSSVLVLPSRVESFGVVLLEAMASGLPVVASRVGGVPEILDGVGLLCEPGDPASLAERVRSVLEDARLALSMAGRGRERVSGYGWPGVAAKVLGVYREVLAGRAKQA
ncbi:MAG: glycosyltransferase family 4 protein [Nitrososphaerota archaeon]|nr:glycosyltransferase family 4 protein [Nitrososphaerota archaeon]